MSEKSAFLSPLPLAVVGGLVILAVVVVLTRSADSGDNEKEAPAGGELSSKSSSRHESTPGPSHEGKSTGKTDEERYKHLSPEEFREVVAGISVSAKDELQALRQKYATKFDDPEEHKAFQQMVSQISDENEIREAYKQRSLERKRARQKAESSKTPKDRAREKQLNVLMQIHTLCTMSDYVSKNPNLTESARDFDTKLVQWVRDHESMNPATFHQSFNKLRAEVYGLRTRHAAERKAGKVE